MKKGLLLLAVILAGCMGQSGRQMLSDVNFKKYAQSDCAKWIAIPATADGITVFGFFGFDTNYRYLRCSVARATTNLVDLVMQSIASQPRKTNDTFVIVQNAHITAEAMQSVFGGFPGSVPQWWRTDFSRFDQQAYCAWNTNHYGYGYIYLLDSKEGALRAFQWSQQHNTAETTVKTLGN
jgi:hypothetical protein